jgi:hypothetical protein
LFVGYDEEMGDKLLKDVKGCKIEHNAMDCESDIKET